MSVSEFYLLSGNNRRTLQCFSRPKPFITFFSLSFPPSWPHIMALIHQDIICLSLKFFYFHFTVLLTFLNNYFVESIHLKRLFVLLLKIVEITSLVRQYSNFRPHDENLKQACLKMNCSAN